MRPARSVHRALSGGQTTTAFIGAKLDISALYAERMGTSMVGIAIGSVLDSPLR